MNVWKKHCKNFKRISNAPQTYPKRSQQIPQTHLKRTATKQCRNLATTFYSLGRCLFWWATKGLCVEEPMQKPQAQPKTCTSNAPETHSQNNIFEAAPMPGPVDLRFSDASNKKVNAWQKQCTNLNKRISNAPPAPSKYFKSTITTKRHPYHDLSKLKNKTLYIASICLFYDACTVEGRLNDGFFLTKK